MDLVQVSVAMSLDGCIDRAGGERLVLSGAEDLREVQAARAAADAVLVGAGTLRRDDPRLTVRVPELRQGRLDRGLPADPARVALTRSGTIDPDAAFFAGDGRRFVLCPTAVAPGLRRRLGAVATVLPLERTDAPSIVAALEGVGIDRLLVEGGTQVLTLFLASGCFHRLRLAVAPFFVGQAGAPRLAAAADYLHGGDRRLRVVATRSVGGIAVIELENDAAVPRSR
ncbi:RibD family protein [Rhodospirillum centenum]|uniref:5-amino-6-(5-phosphoribosylamino)uracil reductase, putative n=1 Tax=Rhodospirillum centenum (strain ATCC 51521 / SW) TaxID=414684 RepID=B6IW36_RHOCS|nr:RibD family protein [Rhodospirillum centenum]ACJ00510.1 5-amino-6-(5-phosphoribosylamino)uracil reductase, putative [Rhodospirillum centenum SW]